MEPDKGEMLRQRQLAFIGRVIAGFTDKIQDHLGTIRESAGWLDELLGQEGQGAEEDRKKFVDIVSTIESQAKILVQKIQHLNRFAQRMGAPFTTFDPGEIVDEAVFFTTRFARVRDVSLRPEVAETLPSLYSDPVRLHFLVLILIKNMLERVSKGGKVLLRAGSVEKGVLIEVEGHGTLEVMAPEERNPYWSLGQQVVADLGGHMQTTMIAPGKKRTSLFLPINQVPNVSQI
ncbi:MAG: hypothetical protein JRJ42_01830 [Deltaproteobacteria bacterium]|nr:hypothetical protein [Deltaproteobacteria bacterium]MBW2018661.1 hypothetical protein [Deltaproteobacteria bacterium]MBW2073390.1 hypothetical protein [Deltaproteobacteria bacterium]